MTSERTEAFLIKLQKFKNKVFYFWTAEFSKFN